MRGIKYNMKFKLLDGEIIEKQNLNMKELCSECNVLFKNNYNYDVNMNKDKCYNLWARKTCNKYIRSILEIERL